MRRGNSPSHSLMREKIANARSITSYTESLSPLGGQKGENMCTRPKIIKNPRYKASKKNNFNPPRVEDERKLWISAPCGECEECAKAKSSAWRVRLSEEIKKHPESRFVTLTFSEESMNEMIKEVGDDANKIFRLAVHRFRERYRINKKRSLRYVLISELGHKGTERLHLHGVVDDVGDIGRFWKYGFVYVGYSMNQRCINYVVKYIMKRDARGYTSRVLCSNGIGSGMRIEKTTTETPEEVSYVLRTGQKVAMPEYYRRKMFTDEQRENMWTKRLDEGTRYVGGVKIKDADGANYELYEKTREYYDKKSLSKGYRPIRKYDKFEAKKERKNLERKQK